MPEWLALRSFSYLVEFIFSVFAMKLNLSLKPEWTVLITAKQSLEDSGLRGGRRPVILSRQYEVGTY